METSELEMTPPDSPKATKEEKKAPAPEDDLLGDLFPKPPQRDRSWRNGSASDSSPEGYAFESRIGH